MLIKRAALAAALPATTSDDTRYHLQAVQVSLGHTVEATDGHIAVRITDTAPLLDTEYPIISGAEMVADQTGPVLLPADVCKKLIGVTPKKTTIPVMQSIRFGRNGQPDTVLAVATDLQTPMIATIRTDESGNFPNLDRVIPPADKAGTVTLIVGTEVLEVLIKAAKAVKNSHAAVYLQIPTAPADRLETKTADDGTPIRDGPVCSAVRFAVKGADGLEMIGALMPMRN